MKSLEQSSITDGAPRATQTNSLHVSFHIPQLFFLTSMDATQ